MGELILHILLDDRPLNAGLASGLEAGEQNPDEDEFLSVERISFEKLYKMVLDGEIMDSKTQIGVFQAAAKIFKK